MKSVCLAAGVAASLSVFAEPVQLSYCLSIQTRTRTYLVKGKGLLLSKLPRTTGMKPLSR